MKMKARYFVVPYIIIGLFLGVMAVNDYTYCLKLIRPADFNYSSSVTTMDYAPVFYITGALWPFMMPGIIALYNQREGHICIN